MAYYRLYFFDGGGSIENFREFELQHDLVAIRQAAEWRKEQTMELWTGVRMVKRWDQPGNRAGASCSTYSDTIQDL